MGKVFLSCLAFLGFRHQILVLKNFCCTYNGFLVADRVWGDALAFTVLGDMQLYSQNQCKYKKISVHCSDHYAWKG